MLDQNAPQRLNRLANLSPNYNRNIATIGPEYRAGQLSPRARVDGYRKGGKVKARNDKKRK